MDKLQLIRFLDQEAIPTRNADMTGTQMTYHVLSKTVSGTEGLVADYIELPPGFVHGLHRHPNADQVVIPLSGPPIEFTVEDTVQSVCPGSLGIAHRGRWHQIINTGAETFRGLVMFLGVSTMEEAGYESWAATAEPDSAGPCCTRH